VRLFWVDLYRSFSGWRNSPFPSKVNFLIEDLLVSFLVGRDIFSRLPEPLLVGGGPTASYLFCFAKKGNPKKATALNRPSGAQWCTTKNGKVLQLATLRHQHFLFPFFAEHHWRFRSGTAKPIDQRFRKKTFLRDNHTKPHMMINNF
jgi:hypothetical protein